MSEKCPNYGVSPERFVETWEASESAIEAGAKLGMPADRASSRANCYRKAGIKLKKMRAGRRKSLKVDALNRKIDGLSGGSQ